jgi:hypothetical protein
MSKKISGETIARNFQERKYQDFLDSYKDLCKLKAALSSYTTFSTTRLDEEVLKGLTDMKKAVVAQVKAPITKQNDIQFAEMERWGTWIPVRTYVVSVTDDRQVPWIEFQFLGASM